MPANTHHSQYVVWVEKGRSDLMRLKGFTSYWWERVTVRTWVESLRSWQIVFGYEIVNTDSRQAIATGTVKLMTGDRQNVRWKTLTHRRPEC